MCPENCQQQVIPYCDPGHQGGNSHYNLGSGDVRGVCLQGGDVPRTVVHKVAPHEDSRNSVDHVAQRQRAIDCVEHLLFYLAVVSESEHVECEAGQSDEDTCHPHELKKGFVFEEFPGYKIRCVPSEG